MKYFKFFWLGMALLSLGSCKKSASPAGSSAAIGSYPVTTLEVKDVAMQWVYPVVLKGEDDVDIKPRVEGFIESVNIDEGSIVKRGQVLFKISSPSSVQQIETATANYNTAVLDLERMKPLAEKGIISTVRIKTYENNVSTAKAALDQAKANFGFTNVSSPVNGVVGSVPYRTGSLVTSSTVLTTVANTVNVIANFSLNEKEIIEFMKSWPGTTQAEKISNIPPVTLKLADGSDYETPGRIETISGVVDANTGSVNMRASFKNTQGLMRSGTSGKIIIPRTLKSVFVIPQKATINQQDKVLVYKVQGDSVVQKIIQVKATPDGKSFAVLSGLAAGDKIVTDGVATLKNGKKIKEL